MLIDAKNSDIKARSSRRVVHANVARWRLGSDDYLQSLDQMRPPAVTKLDASADVPVPTSTFDNSRELAGLVEKSLLRTSEILNMPIQNGDGADEGEQNARARMLLSAVRTVLMTQLRADDNVLKRTATTKHTAMLRELKALRAGPVIDVAAE